MTSSATQLTAQNLCEIRDIQAAAKQHGVILRQQDLILEAVNVTHETSFSTAMDAYYKQLVQEGYVSHPTCRINSSPAR